MMEIVCIRDGQIVETHIVDEYVPRHAEMGLIPVVEEGDGINTSIEIEAERVVRRHFNPPLEQYKDHLLAGIDQRAADIRSRSMPRYTGMQILYEEKRQQAEAVHAMGEAAANAMSHADAVAAFPTLAASIGIEAPTLYACAQIVIERYEAWASGTYALERTRLAGKMAVRDAADHAAALSAYEAIQWPM
jgi:hypothetical protein